jgi:hypothetical protein
MSHTKNDQRSSKWLRVPLCGLAGLTGIVVATAALNMLGIGTSNGAWPGFLGAIALAAVWYLTSNPKMIRLVSVAVLGTLALSAAVVAYRILA